jgi:cytochrome c oxidase assembly protein subunit 15
MRRHSVTTAWFHRTFTPQKLKLGGSSAFLARRSCAAASADASAAAAASAAASSAAAANAAAAAAAEIPLPKRNIHVARWLYFTSAFVGGIVVVGGITRLTESGLSIVEWKPIRGVIPPITQAEWEEEFAKYKQFPEFQQKPDMTLEEFKFIFFWEWFHRVLARSVGVVFGAPLIYFAARGYFKGNKKFLAKLFGCMALGGGQGALGWYMVKSGLKKELLDKREKATVSAYRLAAHLSLAFLIFACVLRLGLSLKVRPVYVPNPVLLWMARLTTGTMYVTAVSGAFVAGLDAGLLYCDTFPLMGEGILPPVADVMALSPPLRNLFENGTAAQLWHRMMAGTTTWFVLALNYTARRHRATMPLQVRKALKGVNHALAFQVLLGFATLLTYVATPVAALHQLNSMALLGMLIRLCATMTRRAPVMLL